MYENGVQSWRSVARLVASHFPILSPANEFAKISVGNDWEAFNTPINLNGDRWDNRAINLAWRPRWFAIRYNKEINLADEHFIRVPIMETYSQEIFEVGREACVKYGLLTKDLAIALNNEIAVWPTDLYFVYLD